MVLRVTQYGEPVLRRKGKRVEVFDEKLRKLADDMVDTMHEHEGTGLAAQQVGENILMFVIDLSWNDELNQMPYTLDGRHPPLDMLMPMVLVNADVRRMRGDTIVAEEGCLSFPDLRGDVPRDEFIRCTYQDLDGAEHVLEAGDWLARVLQHEYDHTQGVLFIDRMDKKDYRRLEGRLRRLKRNSRQHDVPKSE